jgi:hypothetical protein
MSVEFTLTVQIVCDDCKNHRSSRMIFENPNPNNHSLRLLASDKLWTEVQKKGWTKELSQSLERVFFFCDKCTQKRKAK